MRDVTATKLYRLFALAAIKQVSLSLHYIEAADQWRADVYSAAPAERLETRDHSFPVMYDIVREHLQRTP